MRVRPARLVAFLSIVAALGLATWMQNDAHARRYSVDDDGPLPPAPAAVAAGVMAAGRIATPVERGVEGFPALVADQGLAVRLDGHDVADAPLPRSANQAFSAYGIACRRPDLILMAEPGGQLVVRINAPCLPGSTVEVSYGALAFGLAVNAFGQASLSLPAVSRKSWVTARFADGSSVIRRKTIPDFDDDRAVLLLAAPEGKERGGTTPVFWVPDEFAEIGRMELLAVENVSRQDPTAIVPAYCGVDLSGLLISTRAEDDVRPISLAMPECGLTGAQVVVTLGQLTGKSRLP